MGAVVLRPGALKCSLAGLHFLLLGLLLSWALPDRAQAHASLLRSAPPEGAVLQSAPEVLELDFNQSIRPLIARLTDESGASTLLDPPEQQGATTRYRLPPGLANGSYLLSWRVTAEDGHVLSGGLGFAIGEPGPPLSAAPDPGAQTRQILLFLAQAGLVFTLLLSAGSRLFSALAQLPGIRGAAGVGLVFLLLATGARGLELTGAPVTALATLAPWREAATGAPGLALLAAGVALAGRLVPGRAGLALVLIATALAFTLSGHAAPLAWMPPLLALHVLCAAFWLGALPVLLRNSPRGLALFSRAIPFALAALFATGSAIAVIQLAELPALWRSDYGRVLLAKLALVAALLVLALINRIWLTPQAAQGDARGLRRLRAVICVELGLMLGLVAVLGLWRFTPPPRVLPPAPAEGTASLSGAGGRVVLRFTPDHAGPVRLQLAELQGSELPTTPVEGHISLSKPAFGLGPFERSFTYQGALPLELGNFLLPMDGFWVAEITLKVSDFRQSEMKGILTLNPR